MISLMHDSGNCVITLDVQRPGSKRPKVVISLKECSKHVRKQVHEAMTQLELGSHVAPIALGPDHTLVSTLRLTSHHPHVRRQQAEHFATALYEKLYQALDEIFAPSSEPVLVGAH